MIEEALEELYSADPSEFTKKRDALAKELKKAGDKEGAAAVAARRKPTQIAWVLNRLARKHPEAIAELVDVGRELARAQRGESAALREAIDRQRKAIIDLTQKTNALMKELGVDPAGHLEAITAALQAALVDPVVGAQLEQGRLEKAPEAVIGFGGPMAAEPSEPRPASLVPTKTRGPNPHIEKPKKDDAADEAAKAAEAAAAEKKKAKAAHAKELAEAREVLEAAESAATKARHVAEHAEKEANAALDRAKRLAAQADAKDAVAAAAKKELARVTANAPE